MLGSIRQDGLHMTIAPGFTWDADLHVFRGPVLYGDETLMLCVTKERMRRSLNSTLDLDDDIEQLFDPTNWISEAEHEHNPDVYFEDDELGPDV